jgi:hypothetical protein
LFIIFIIIFFAKVNQLSWKAQIIMNKFTTRRSSRIPRLSRSEKTEEVKYVARHTVLGGKTKQEWSQDIAIQGLANICKAKKASHAPRFAQGLEGRMNSRLEVMTNTLQEWICQSTASAAGITHKSAGQAVAVVQEEEAGADDEGLVELTGSYKTLQLDIQRLKERLRYISKKWQIRIIAICEEDQLATEQRQGSLFKDVLDKQDEAVVLNCLEEETQAIAQVVISAECKIIEQVESQRIHDSTETDNTVISVILLQKAEVKIKLLNCDYDHASEKQLAGQYLNRVTMQGRGRKVTTIEQLVEVPVASLVHGKLARATNKMFMRWVFDPGGTQPGRH